MANTYQKCRIQLRTDAPTTWSQNNPVLANGEIGLVKSGQNYDFVVGDGSTRYNNLKKVIGENPVITNLSSTVQSYTSRINTLQENITMLEKNVDTDRVNFDLDLMNNYTTSSKMLTEYIPDTDIQKSTMIRQWSEWITSGIMPKYRFTDAVSWDSVFLIISVMRKARMISFTDEQAIDFGEKLIAALIKLSDCPENTRRAVLSTYRENVIGH